MDGRLRDKRGWFSSDSFAVAAPSLAMMAVTSIPAVTAFAFGAVHGVTWNGRLTFAPGDAAVYLSYVRQVQDGAWLVDHLYTGSATVPSLNILWLAVGLLARALPWSPLAAYQAARLLLIPLLVAVMWWSARHFLRDRAARFAAVTVALFGSGLGAWAAPLIGVAGTYRGHYPVPPDLWVAESLPFLSAVYSPHFLAGWILLIGSLTWFAKSLESGRPRPAVIAGLLALALLEFHPYHAFTLFAVAGAGALALAATGRRWWLSARATGLLVLPSLPAVAYHWWLTRPAQNGGPVLATNLCYTPPPLHVLIGFGAMVPLAALGAWWWRREQPGRAAGLAFLGAWIAVQASLLYAPVVFQRRLIEGIAWPLALLSGLALAALWRSLRRHKNRHLLAPWAVMLLVAFLLPTSFYAVIANYRLMTRSERSLFYRSPDTLAAARWLRANVSDRRLIMSEAEAGNDLLGLARGRFYLAHWSAETDETLAAVRKFFGAATGDGWRTAFLSEHRIDYVHERAEADGAARLVGKPYLRLVFESGPERIYRVVR
jgi:hypothetical protein